MKEKLAFVHIPDATKKDITQLTDELRKLTETEIQLPYRLVFIGGREWNTLSKKELVELLKEVTDT